MHKTLVYIDGEDPRQEDALFSAARRVCADTGSLIYAAALESVPLANPGNFDLRIVIKDGRMARFDLGNIVDCLEAIHGEHQFDCILTAASRWGRMTAPALAMRLRTGIIADVTRIKREGPRVYFIRPAFGGKLFACIESGAAPLMASVNLNAFEGGVPERKNTETVFFIPPGIRECGVTLLKEEKRELPHDIRKCGVLVSGGGGAAKCFEKLAPLAEALGGETAASRKLVDLGVTGRNIQVGQSGKTVSPKLYFALGIHGSLQHMEGLKNVDHIISVNTNRDAPICSVSDIVVEGDASSFIDKLLTRMRSR